MRVTGFRGAPIPQVGLSSSSEPVGCAKAFMQLAGIRGADRRADRVDEPRPADPRRQPPAQQVGPVPQARAPDADDAGCRARPRPARPAPSGFVLRSGASPGTRRGPCGPIARRTRSPWAPARASRAPATFGAEYVVEAGGELRVPVTEQEAYRRPRSSSTSNRLRACWVTQRLSGLAVTPARCTRLVSCSMKNSTYSRRNQTVSTVKKSQATIPAACWRRDTCQLPDARLGAGSSP
jgi:hypothetical protein